MGDIAGAVNGPLFLKSSTFRRESVQTMSFIRPLFRLRWRKSNHAIGVKRVHTSLLNATIRGYLVSTVRDRK